MRKYRKEKDRKIIAVPDYFLKYCIEKTTCEEHKRDLKKASKENKLGGN